jgi:hypothetical protein
VLGSFYNFAASHWFRSCWDALERFRFSVTDFGSPTFVDMNEVHFSPLSIIINYSS